MKSVDSMQLGLMFYLGANVPAANPDDEDEAGYAIHKHAVLLVAAGLTGLPSWQLRLDDNGFPSTDKDAGWYQRAELCESSGETEMVNGRPAYSIWFHSSGTFPLDLAQDLKSFCLAKYTEAAGAVPVEFAQASRYTQWSETETVTWPEV